MRTLALWVIALMVFAMAADLDENAKRYIALCAPLANPPEASR